MTQLAKRVSPAEDMIKYSRARGREINQYGYFYDERYEKSALFKYETYVNYSEIVS